MGEVYPTTGRSRLVTAQLQFPSRCELNYALGILFMVTHTPHILVVDDQASIVRPLLRNLETNGFRATGAETASRARALIKRNAFDLVILDIMMPGEDGLSLCQHLRAETEIPVILLTAMADDDDVILGLEVGADDYLTKPFNPRELIARIRSVLRRAQSGVRIKPSRRFGFGDWTLDIDRSELTRADGLVETLSTGELEVLKVLIAAPFVTLSRDDILNRTKGREALPFERSIDVMVSRLRQKIEPSKSNPDYIKTVWGGGYRFNVAVTPS